MTDYIDRQAAIDALGERPVVWDEWTDEYTLGQRKQYDYDKLAIEALPSAEVEPVKHGRWIPVSERLPKKDGRYLVTRYDYVTSTEFIDILWYEKNLWWNMRYTGDYAVIAWMPLPKGYKGE